MIVYAWALLGWFVSLADFNARINAPRETVDSLIRAGAFDSLTAGRCAALWEAGLLYRSAAPAASAGRAERGRPACDGLL